MKHTLLFCISALAALPPTLSAKPGIPEPTTASSGIGTDSIVAAIDSSYLIVRELPEILNQLGDPDFYKVPVNKVFAPWVFSGYRALEKKTYDFSIPVWLPGMKVMSGDSIAPLTQEGYIIEGDTLKPVVVEIEVEEVPAPLPSIMGDATPKWLREALTAYRIQEDFIYSRMVSDPLMIEYALWDLPERPKLPEDDHSFATYLKKLDLPDVAAQKALLPENEIRKIHWLHRFNAGLQFSQAYLSSNWYQGGSNNTSLILNLGWSFDLNQVYHPNLLLQSSLSYKLGLFSTPDDDVHKFRISEDVLQYNLNAGVKAFKKKWYYSMNVTFKTQILNNYGANSNTKNASFLSPGDFNVGLGMSYSTTNKKKTLNLTASIAPLSYNMKTCIAENDVIAHSRFNISPNRYVNNDLGSNGKINMNWKIYWNINYSTSLFLFTNYHYFLSDWENTFSFNVNKYLSTQLYLRLRYDTSTNTDTKWKHLMMREILSFGLTYTFSTKP